MTKPEHVRRWWGCLDDRYSVPVCEIDLARRRRLALRRARSEGQYPAFYGVYREIDAARRLVYTEIFEPFPDVESVVTQILTEEDGKTRLTVTVAYPSLEVRDMVLKTGMENGAAISYDRLDDVARRNWLASCDELSVRRQENGGR